MFQGKIEVPTPGRVALIQQGCEENGLKWQAMQLNVEVAMWDGYNAHALQWQCPTELAKHANITEIDGIMVS